LHPKHSKTGREHYGYTRNDEKGTECQIAKPIRPLWPAVTPKGSQGCSARKEKPNPKIHYFMKGHHKLSSLKSFLSCAENGLFFGKGAATKDAYEAIVGLSYAFDYLP